MQDTYNNGALSPKADQKGTGHLEDISMNLITIKQNGIFSIHAAGTQVKMCMEIGGRIKPQLQRTGVLLLGQICKIVNRTVTLK